MEKTMENNTYGDSFYHSLTAEQKQQCDLCRDWGFGGCERCKFTSQNFLRLEVKNMNVILYTIDCPNCLVLETKLKEKDVKFLRISDESTIKAKGYGDSTFPILEVDGIVMSYSTAIQWVNSL